LGPASRWSVKKSGLKRDGPIFFSFNPVKVAGDERTTTAIVALQWEGRRVAVPNPFTMEKTREPNFFPEPQPAPVVLYFYPCYRYAVA
jgi:hypothetical protein